MAAFPDLSSPPPLARAFGTVGAFGCLACAFALSAQPREPDPAVLDEIIVQAQKRNESAQDVPLAVTALTSDVLRDSGILTLLDLTDQQTSVSFDTAQSFQRNSLKIRGVGTIGNSRSFEGAVGVFVDGVYRSRSGMVLMDLLDIDNIEILRGPQSTLFGKNTVAGTISVTSARPSGSELNGYLDARLANYDERYLSGAINVPVGDATTLRFAGSYRNRDGFFESPDTGATYDEVDRSALKAQLLFAPTDALEMLVIADSAHSSAACCWSAAIVFNGPTSPLIGGYGALNGLTFVPAPDAESERAESLNTPSRERIEDDGLTVRVHYDAGATTLTSITSVRDWSHDQIAADADFSPADLFMINEPAEIDSVSQEVNWAIPLDRADLLLGLYWAEEDYDSLRSAETGADADNYLNALISANLGATTCFPPLSLTGCAFPTGIGALLPDGEFTREQYHQKSESRALFAHASIELTSALNLVTGLRYMVEDKQGGVTNLYWYDSAIARAVLAAAGVPDDGTPRNGLDLIGTLYSPSFEDGIDDEVTTGLLSLQYRFNDGLMLYGGYHRGYKAGGVNLFREGVITETVYQPETADSLEAGLKIDYLGGRARTNIAIFDTDFEDLQINFFTGLEFRTVNTGKASTRGIEIENQLQVNDRLRLDINATHLDAKFRDLDDPFLAYLIDRDMPEAPSWAAAVTATYERPLSAKRNLFLRGFASYVGSHYVEADVPAEQKASSYTITQLDVGIKSDSWEALLWCQNCGDTSYRTVFFNSVFQPGSYSTYLNEPRRYGVTIRARF
jgi:outer membrane receptor protein involved in Fe transport